MMPEGPEVKVTADFLRKTYGGMKLKRIEIVSGRYHTHEPPEGLQTLVNNHPGGLTLLDVGSRGKFLYFTFEHENYCFCTLGMTGNWSSHSGQHTRLNFVFDGKIAYFADTRNFGTLKFLKGKKHLEAKLSSLGWDPLSDSDDNAQKFESLQSNFTADARPMCEILMDQRSFAGVGNYLKAEILYAARLSPHRLGTSLSPGDIRLIFDKTVDIMRNSYNAGGTTVRDFYVDGGVGHFQKELKVYSKITDPNGELVVREETSDKRTTHWVPTVQK